MVHDFLRFAFSLFIFFLIMMGWVAYAFYKRVTRIREQFDSYRQQRGTQSNEPTITDNRPLEVFNLFYFEIFHIIYEYICLCIIFIFFYTILLLSSSIFHFFYNYF